jgi:hypothetical protein
MKAADGEPEIVTCEGYLSLSVYERTTRAGMFATIQQKEGGQIDGLDQH